ncbi:GAF and ANTAR domain-containing protein [Pseudonocardia oceani]|uniref:GAF and ANTAR domain-containing protein n=1 Tax=Pseudonocardia oceani TaxID=2792013 RepID=A0ABS6U3D7_9PSEU|nr:GAF and ANTAR domain-containing protein [Pseudonocardia oceani]MBW0107238.1 GAF and ANTAR domain-containing protein [Pseudonocardia oceani]MBW0119793.1 GAF and ANTAR domain-containing protein [Pseudonocardia oceani]MBW0126691.1 GAF and ANTAR domain-containing protein [Pseudonocardia oceani]
MSPTAGFRTEKKVSTTTTHHVSSASGRPDDRAGSSGSDGRGRPSSSDTGKHLHPDDLAVHLSELARELQQEPTLDDTLAGIVQAAVDNVPGAQIAAISRVTRRTTIETTACTDELAQRVDRAQYETGQGPCMSTIYNQRSMRLSDMGTEDRWPQFTGRALELGIGSMMSVQLYVEGENLGALNLYNHDPHGFDDESEHIALLLASHAAIALVGSEQHQRLSRGLESRDLIGQAKGILMERYKISSEVAFQLLIRASQATNTKLRDVADHLTSTGEVPGGG